MDKPQIFISHYVEEKEPAQLLGDFLTKYFDDNITFLFHFTRVLLSSRIKQHKEPISNE